MLPGEQPQQAEGLQSKVEIKITHSHWVGLSAEFLEREQRSWVPGKNMATPVLLQTMLAAKMPLAQAPEVWGERERFQLQGNMEVNAIVWYLYKEKYDLFPGLCYRFGR